MLMRTDPFRELDRLSQQMFGTVARPAVMPMNAYRKGDTFHLNFDLPGVKPDSIDLTVERNVLTVHAEREAPEPDEVVELIADECTSGVFTRQVFLGETLDTEHIRADYSGGVLWLQIPVHEAAKPRKVEISSADTKQQISA
jgi:HSP20 family protein